MTLSPAIPPAEFDDIEGAVAVVPARGLRRAASRLDRDERRVLIAMATAVIGLHVAGLVSLIVALGGSSSGGVARGGALSLGVGLTAYALGLRHAFDADHIAAIDNTTRRLMSDGRRPLSVGFWFSLGHSTVVFALALALAAGARFLSGPVSEHGSELHRVTGLLGTLVSGGFLYLIAGLNLFVLAGIVRSLPDMRRGPRGGNAFAEQLCPRGPLSRLFAGAGRRVTSPRRMYPLGILFGLGFDTATEVALLVLAAGAAGSGLPWYAILCLPLLFAAGMSLMDTLDGSFMSFAYGWAFARPARKVFYNVTVTCLSVGAALLVGTVELGGLLAERLQLSGAFWAWLEGIDINTLGFAIVALFVLTWGVAIACWRIGRIERRWSPADEV